MIRDSRKRWAAIHMIANSHQLMPEHTRYFWTRWGAEAYRKSIYECHPLLPAVPQTFAIKIVRNG